MLNQDQIDQDNVSPQISRITDMWRNAVAGGTAGAMSRITTAPLDVLKIRLQLEGGKRSTNYSTFLSTMQSVYAEEGIKGFWRGSPAAMVLWVTYVGAQFCMYGIFRDLIDTRHYIGYADPKTLDSAHHTADKFLAGAAAACVATTVTYPLDILRTAFAGQGVPRKYPTFRSFVEYTFKHSGVGGFYAGLSPALMQVAPQMGITFVCYEAIKNSPPKALALAPGLDTWWPASAGFFSGLISKTAVYPLDTLKKRVQAKVVLDKSGRSENRVLKIVLKEISNEGIAIALYRGMVPALWKASLSTAVTFGTYEWVKSRL